MFQKFLMANLFFCSRESRLWPLKGMPAGLMETKKRTTSEEDDGSGASVHHGGNLHMA